MLFLSVGVRAAARLFFELPPRGAQTGGGQRTLIYGAGFSGDLLLREARVNRESKELICGFIDDVRTVGMSIQGVPVLGSGPDLARLVDEHNIARVLIAMPTATAEQMTRIVGHCQAAGVKFQTMPRLSDIMEDRGLSGQIRDVSVEDVLGRSAVR